LGVFSLAGSFRFLFLSAPPKGAWVLLSCYQELDCSQKHKRTSKSRGQYAAGNAMAAVEPVKSRVDSFGQLV
jgi:hypothetical protein